MCLKKCFNECFNKNVLMKFNFDLFFGSKCSHYYQNYFISVSLSNFNEMAILSNVRKPGNFESYNSLKFSFNNFRGLRSHSGET